MENLLLFPYILLVVVFLFSLFLCLSDIEPFSSPVPTLFFGSLLVVSTFILFHKNKDDMKTENPFIISSTLIPRDKFYELQTSIRKPSNIINTTYLTIGTRINYLDSVNFYRERDSLYCVNKEAEYLVSNPSIDSYSFDPYSTSDSLLYQIHLNELEIHNNRRRNSTSVVPVFIR